MLTLLHNQYAFVPCNSDCLQKYSNATGIRHDPKPLMSDSSPQNYTVPLDKESDQLNSQGVSFSEITILTSEYMSIVMFKDGGTANLSTDFSDVDVG
jgi:hypothetical protein